MDFDKILSVDSLDICVASVILVVFSITAALLTKNILSRYITSEANEWLLVIRGGHCVKKGIGMTTF